MILERPARGSARPEALDGDTFLARRELARRCALAAAEALRDGDPQPAIDATGLPPGALERLVAHPPEVPPPGLAAVLGPPEVLPPLHGVRAGPRWREWAWDHARPTVASTPETRIAWGIDALAFLRSEIERRQRAPWAIPDPAPSPADPTVAEAWRAWPTAPWSVRDAWERAWLPWLLRSVRAVLHARRVPPAARDAICDDLREAFFFVQLGASDRSAGWRELAVRTLETDGVAGPVDALARRLDTSDWARLGLGASTRERWRRTLAVAFPEVGPPARGSAAAMACTADPGQAERLLDLHVSLRAIASWCDPARTRPNRTWDLVTHNRGRARSRLRAVLSERSDLAELVAALPAVHARTAQAVLRYGRDLTWSQLSRGFTFDADTRLDPPCTEQVPEVAPALRTWVLLVVLKGRLGHLERWLGSGTTGDRDSTWGRLLARDLPPGLREHLRPALAPVLSDVVEALRPTIVRLSLVPDDSPASSVESALREGWHPDVPRPQVRYGSYVAQARAFLRRDADGERP